MLKILFFIILFIALSTQNQNDRQSKFDASLGTVVKKVYGTKFPRNQSMDKTKCPSNMRKTNEFAKQINDIFSFVIDYSDNETNSKRSLPIGYTINSTYCPYKNKEIICDSSSKYRTNDGTCNNLNNPFFGASNTPYIRLLPPSYDDGVNSPRKLGLSGKNLPNPRSVSLAVSLPTSTQRLAKNSLGHLYATFGQFLAHDITGTSATTGNYLLN
jgi:hypothetical protein